MQRRGATLALPELSTPLILSGLQVKAEYIYLSVPHPPPTHSALIFFFPARFFAFFSPSVATHLLLYYLSTCGFFLFPLSISLRVFFFVCYISAPGCRARRWNRMFPPVQLPVDNHSARFTICFFLYLALPLLYRDSSAFSCCFLSLIPLPKPTPPHLVAPAVSP